jgi:threonine dehydratase
VPFTCQGTLNGLAVEGGETLGWELAAAVGARGGPERIDRLVVQVGGGALLSAVAAGLGAGGAPLPRIHAVQTSGAHPLARAYGRVRTRADAGEQAGAVLADAARHRSAYMWPWETEPRSVAHGILDDETYDWRACVAAMLAGGGGPLVVSEAVLTEAHALAGAAGSCADPTGAAGLAGLIDLVRMRALAPDEQVVVLFTGARRDGGATTDTRDAHDRAHGHPASGGI